MPHYNCAVVLGATATGKTTLAVKLAHAKHGEIISADSRQVYRGLDLGTGKDLQEYGSIPYHLIDVCDLSREFTVFHFQQEVYRIFPQLVDKGALPIIAGGTGLYLDAILRGRPGLGQSHATGRGRSPRRQVRLPEHTNAALDAYIEKHGTAASAVIRDAVEAYLSRENTPAA